MEKLRDPLSWKRCFIEERIIAYINSTKNPTAAIIFQRNSNGKPNCSCGFLLFEGPQLG